MEDIKKTLLRAGGIDEFLQYIMRELEHCDDMIYNENLSASNYIHWSARKQVLQELRDEYCNYKFEK